MKINVYTFLQCIEIHEAACHGLCPTKLLLLAIEKDQNTDKDEVDTTVHSHKLQQ